MSECLDTLSVSAALPVDSDGRRPASEAQAPANVEPVTMHMAAGPRPLLQTVCGTKFDGTKNRRSMLLADVTCFPCFNQYRATLSPGGMSRKGAS